MIPPDCDPDGDEAEETHSGRLERTAQVFRFPGTVIAGTAWRQEKSCRLFAFTNGVSRRLAVRIGKRSACSFPFLVFGDDGFPFNAKIRTILENLMLSASLTRENISVFAFFIQQRKFSTQPKGLFLRNNCKMPRKKIATCDFSVGKFLRIGLFYFFYCLPHQFIKLLQFHHFR